MKESSLNSSLLVKLVMYLIFLHHLKTWLFQYPPIQVIFVPSQQKTGSECEEKLGWSCRQNTGSSAVTRGKRGLSVHLARLFPFFSQAAWDSGREVLAGITAQSVPFPLAEGENQWTAREKHQGTCSPKDRQLIAFHRGPNYSPSMPKTNGEW